MTKAAELIKKAIALKEAFPAEDYEKLVEHLMSFHGEILYGSGEELKTLYGLVGDRGVLAKDWEAYQALKEKPAREFTSLQVQTAYKKQLDSDPLYRVKVLEGRVKELEERIKRMEESIKGNTAFYSGGGRAEEEEGEVDWIAPVEDYEEEEEKTGMEEVADDEGTRIEEEQSVFEASEFLGIKDAEEVRGGSSEKSESIGEGMEIGNAYGMPHVDWEDEKTFISLDQLQEFGKRDEEEENIRGVMSEAEWVSDDYKAGGDREEGKNLKEKDVEERLTFPVAMREEEEELWRSKKESMAIGEEAGGMASEEEEKTKAMKKKAKEEGGGESSAFPIFTAITALNVAGFIFQRVI